MPVRDGAVPHFALAAEKLREVHGITIGRETLRLWMLDAGIWADRATLRGWVYQPRYRRECVGATCLARLTALSENNLQRNHQCIGL